jgi:hypothetical protein
MARKSKAKFIMPGHSFPGVKGFKETTKEDGKAASSAFQMHQPLEGMNSPLQKGWLQNLTGAATGALRNVFKGGAASALTGGGDNIGGGNNEEDAASDAAAGAKLLKADAKAAMQEDTGLAMKKKNY